jgi:TonB family protein
MKRLLQVYLLAILLFGSMGFLFGDGTIVVESHLFKGTRGAGSPKPGSQVIVQIFSEPFVVPGRQSSSAAEAEFEFVSSMKEELTNIYQLKSVDNLTSSSLIWDGKKESLYETIFAGEYIYSITLHPRLLDDSKVNLGILIQSHKAKQFSAISMEGKEIDKPKVGVVTGPLELRFPRYYGDVGLLETEVVAKLDRPMVLGFPIEGESYFLSVLFRKRVEYTVLGGVVSGPIYTSIKGVDPVCGKMVGRGSGFEKENRAVASFRYRGETYLFCSQECYEKFVKNPERYVREEKKDKLVQPETEVIMPPRPLLQITPLYPEKCKAERIEGTVILEVSTDKDGNVDKVQIIRPLHPELDKAAQDALIKWKYEKVLRDGKPVPAVFAVSVDFKLEDKKVN